MIDHEQGGVRGAPKFPNAPFMEALWLNWLATGNSAHRDAVLNSLKHMLNGGIYDHLGGGLSRYSTDAFWLIPHFEKMLYDNAQLIRFCNWAYAETGEIFVSGPNRRDYHLAAARNALSAKPLLPVSTQTAKARRAASIRGAGKKSSKFWAKTPHSSSKDIRFRRLIIGKAIPSCIGTWQRERTMSRPWTPCGKNCLPRASKRARPGRDDKVLVDWNGLAIAAIAEAGRLFSRTDWIEAAAAAFRFVMESNDADGRLPHSILGPRRSFPGLSSDHAAMANAAVSLFEATGEQDYLQVSDQLSAAYWTDGISMKAAPATS